MTFFRPNPAFEQELKAEPLYQAALSGVAEAAASEARSIAHRIMPAGKGEQIRVVRDGDDVAVANFNHGWHLDEFGSRNNPAYSPLRRGVRSAGLKLREE